MRKCKVCCTPYTPTKPMQSVCGHDCAMTLAVSVRGKAAKVEQVKERKADAVKRDKLKTLGQLTAEAQTAFNQYIRARDYGQPCISSGVAMDWNGNGVDAGHYRSRGSAPHLRFSEVNCHAQSKHDNRYLSGNVTGYRLGLIARIGLEAVEALECDQTLRKYSRDDLKAIKATYTAKTKALKEKQE